MPSIEIPSSSQAALSQNEKKFQFYLQKWKDETGGDSSLTNITSNMNYLRIIGIGAQAIPLILRELQRQPAPWFVALRAITENDNVGRNFPGDFKKKAFEWIQWGKDNGHL
jgi:hypothetical protein